MSTQGRQRGGRRWGLGLALALAGIGCEETRAAPDQAPPEDLRPAAEAAVDAAPDQGPPQDAAPADRGLPPPPECLVIVDRAVACEILAPDQREASLQVCATSSAAARSQRARCVAMAAACPAVFACLAGEPVDQGPVDQGPVDQGPADQGPADQGPADQGPADQGPADQGPAPGCPAGWEVLALEARPDGRFEGAGSTLGAAVQAGPASCGGGAGDRVFAFEAPAAGRWRFETFSDALDVDTVLSVRAVCDAPASELGCSDDAAADEFTSRVDVALAAGQRVFAVVDGLTVPDTGYAWQGPFRLVVRPLD